MPSRSARLPVLAIALGAVVLAVGGAATGSVFQPTVVSDTAAAYTPNLEASPAVPRPRALAVSQSGDTVYVGGRFTTVADARGTVSYHRPNIVAFGATTGDVSPKFAPHFNGAVFAVLGVGDALYVGGQFTTVDGAPRPALAKLNAVTGALDPEFDPPAIRGGRVSEIRLVNRRLIVAGTFRAHLLALNPVSGSNTGYIHIPITGKLPLTTNKTEVYRFAVNRLGTRLVGVGNFTAVADQNRRRAFMLNLGPNRATLDSWYYTPLNDKCRANSSTRQAYLEDVDFSPNGRYFVFVSTGYIPETRAEIGIAICDAAARFETDVPAPARPTWINYTGGDSLHSVAVTGAAVYVQGHNRWLDNPYGRDSAGPGAVDRLGIGALNSVTGKALAWAPPKPAAQGGQDFLATSRGLWIASDSLRFNGKYHHGIAFAPLP